MERSDNGATDRRFDGGFRYTAIIPTLNAAGQIDRLLEALLRQALPPEQILVVDSASGDDTIRRAKGYEGVDVVLLEPGTFDHGGTRDMAIRAAGTPFVTLLTQDALPMDAHWAEELLKPFEDERVAAVCGRQIARPEARAAERAIRDFRYGAQSYAWDKTDLPRLGVRSYLISDVCAAYRRESYLAVGGFEHPILTNEDMLIAADFLNAGYRLAYSAQAKVWHSHDHTLRQEYLRNRRVGEFLVRYRDRLGDTGETGEGFKLVKQVTQTLLREGKGGELLPFWANCGARLLGNRAGKRRGSRAARSGRHG